MAVWRLDSVPIGGNNFNKHIGVGRKFRQCSSAVEWGGFQFRVWIRQAHLKSVLQFVSTAFQALQRKLGSLAEGGFLRVLLDQRSSGLLFEFLLFTDLQGHLAVILYGKQLLLYFGE